VERTVGQLVGETIRAYGNGFVRLLPLGIPLAVVDQSSVHEPAATQAIVFWVAAPFVVGAYVYACGRVHRVELTWTAFLVGLVIYAPFPALRALYILPGIAWFAFIGLAVPAVLVERLGFRPALVRGRELGLADYVHALGSLATLVLVVGIAEITLTALLHSQGDSSSRAALFLADLVLTPMLFLGAALLYDDQAARVGFRSGAGTAGTSATDTPSSLRLRDADLHPPLDPDAARRTDPEGQS
jgi:hypothetical protein